MKGRDRFLAALHKAPVDRAPVCNPTSVATVQLMDLAQARFPDAHRVPELMVRLAATGYTELGFDSIMPVFSVVQESSALGCQIEWGDKGDWPTVNMRPPLCKEPEDIKIPSNFLTHPDTRCVLRAIEMLKRLYGDEVAIVGKAMGPWTQAYHCFGLENFLLMSVDDPGKTQKCLDRLKDATLQFALAQIDAGADALTLPDHATGDLVSAGFYDRYLRELHTEFAHRLPVPLILHICGKTLDRMESIAQTGMAGFHFDSKNDPVQAVRIARERITLVGNINNPVTLVSRGPEEVRQEVRKALVAGVKMIGPECAIPLTTPVENLRAITLAVGEWHRERASSNGM